MLSAAFRPRSHCIGSNPFIRRCIHLSVPRSATSLLNLGRCDCHPGARHASNTASAHITSYDSSSTSALEGQSSVPVQKKRGEQPKKIEPKVEDVSSRKTKKTRLINWTMEHEEPTPLDDLPKDPFPPEELQLSQETKPPKQSKSRQKSKAGESSKEPKVPKVRAKPSKEQESPNELGLLNKSTPSENPKKVKALKSPKVLKEPEPIEELESPREPESPKRPKKLKTSTVEKESKSTEGSKKSKKSEAKKEPKAAKPRKIANLPPKQIEDFLDRIEKEGSALTAAEFERYKPSVRPSESSPRYEQAYTVLMSTILRSFRVEQLEEIADIYRLKPPPGSSRTKKEYAVLLMEKAWGWTSVEKIQEKKRDQEERADIIIHLKAFELSLLLGQDGSRLEEVAARYDVKVQVNRGPDSIRVIGRLGHTKQFQGYLDNFRQDVVTEEIALPPGSHVDNVDESTAERVSRITGAFVKKEGGKLHISFLKDQRASAEKVGYLIAQALSNKRVYVLPGALLSGPLSLYTNHDTPISYSLFPFAAHRSHTTKDPNLGTFRLRRIGHWLDTIHPRDGIGLGDGHGRTSSIVFGHGHSMGLYGSLTTPFPRDIAASDISISATCGHILFSTSSFQHHPLRSPLPGQLTVNNILGQAMKPLAPQKKFYPCTPSNLESQAPQQRIRKLTYIASEVTDNSTERLNETLVFEIQDEQHMPQADVKACYLQKEFVLELLMPDRPLDVQMFATSCEDIDPTEWSDQFDLMNDTIDAPSRPPLSLTFRHKTYTLQSHSTIYRKYLQNGTSSTECVTVDKILDNYSGLTTSLAKITCGEHQIEPSWKSFLRRCDKLTSAE